MARPTLSDLTAFAAVAEHRSFRRAADTLGVSRSSLSHAIAALERGLGVRLLHRTTRSVAPTQAGDRLLHRLGPIIRDLDNAIDAVADDGGQPGGTLRINGGEEGMRFLLREVLPCFLDRQPQVSLDLVIEGSLVDIVEDGFDAGIRLAEAVPLDMIAVPLSGDVRFLAVAAPSHLQSAGKLAIPDDLRQHRCIRQRLPSGKLYRWEFEKNGQEIAIDIPGDLTLNHTLLMIEAAADGLGIAYVPETAVTAWLENGRLVPLLEEWSPPVGGLRLYYSGHRHVPASLRAFIDVMTEISRSKSPHAAAENEVAPTGSIRVADRLKQARGERSVYLEGIRRSTSSYGTRSR